MSSSQHIGLPWDAACLAFHTSKRAVKTASVAQVRKPVYNTSVERWRRYGDGLAPLLEALHYPRSDAPGQAAGGGRKAPRAEPRAEAPATAKATTARAKTAKAQPAKPAPAPAKTAKAKTVPVEPQAAQAGKARTSAPKAAPAGTANAKREAAGAKPKPRKAVSHAS